MSKADLAIMASMGAVGAFEIMKKEFTKTQLVGYEHIKNMIQVTESIYVSTAYNVTLIIDAENGEVYRPHPSRYMVELMDSTIYLKDLRNHKLYKVLEDNILNFGNLKGIARGYSTQGSEDYKIIVHNYLLSDGKKYRIKFRIHLLIAATKYGFHVLDAMGMYDRELVVHHIDLNKKNNAISNLILLTREQHIELHTNLNRELKMAS